MRDARTAPDPHAAACTRGVIGLAQAARRYEIIERLAHRGRLAPITVYRALDFLRDNGLVHRIESRNAFVACVHHHADGDPVVFLICRALRNGWRSDRRRRGRCAQTFVPGGGFRAEKPGHRNRRHLRALPRVIVDLFR
jgi:hypothetical protein